ncbi:MAG: dockerin type I repeat-containing protein [Breznakia sp.]
MYEVSNAFHEAISKATRRLDCFFLFDDKKYNPVNLTINDNIYGTEENFIGTFIAKNGTVKVDFNDGLNLENESIELSMGVYVNEKDVEYVPFGTFHIYEVKSKTEYQVMDSKMLFNKTFDTSKINYPITVKELLKEACVQAGAPLNDTTLPNEDLAIPSEVFFGVDATCSNVVEAVATATCSIARINREDELELKWFTKTDVQIGIHAQSKQIERTDVYGPVNSLVLSRMPQNENVYIQDEEAIKQNGLTEIKIANNPILDVDKYESRNAVFERLNGFKYVPFKCELQGQIHLDSCDVVQIEDREGEFVKACLFNHTLYYSGGVKSTFETAALTKTQIDYSAASSIESKIMNAELTVNKIDGEVKAIVEEQVIQGEKLTKMEIDVDSIASTVEELNNYNIVRNFNGEEVYNSWQFSQLGRLPETDLLPFGNLLPMGIDSPIFVVKAYPNSLSGMGLYFDTSGSATSQTVRVVKGGERYSFKCKREEFTERFSFYIQEFDKVDSELKKETKILDTKTPRLYEQASITLGGNTQFVRVRFETYGESFGVSECMFNRGEAREWVRNPDDVYFYAKSEIELLSDEINLKVSKDGIVSSINQSAEEIKINADKLSLEGTTTINNKVMIDNEGKLYAEDATFSGQISGSSITGSRAEIVEGAIGNFEIRDGVMEYTSLEYEREYSSGDLSALKALVISGRGPTDYEIYIYDVNGDGKVTAADYVLVKNHLLNLSDKPKKPMIQAQIIIGKESGEFTSNVLYNKGESIGLASKIIAGQADLGAVNVKGLAIDDKSVEVDEQGFLKLI